MALHHGGAGGGGVSAADLEGIAWAKSWFEGQNLLPPTVLAEDADDYPEPDDTGVSSCTITRLRSRCEFNHAAAPGRGSTLWDAGSAKASWLIWVGEMYCKNWLSGLYLASALDANKEVDTGYRFVYSKFDGAWKLHRFAAGTPTEIGTLTHDIEDTAFGIGLFYDGTTIIGLVRMAGGCRPWPLFSVADATHAGIIRYAGVTHVADATKTYAAAPVVVRHT